MKNEKTIRILPKRGLKKLDISELWEFRDLMFLLVWRDIRAKYKQTILGVGWVVFQPILMMLVFTLIFKQIVKMSYKEIPYSLFCYTGLVPWTFFSSGVNRATVCLVNEANLIKKVYFPRLAVPIASIASSFVDFLISLFTLLIIHAFFRMTYHIQLTLLPAFIILLVGVCIALGILTSAINAKYRDVKHIVPFFVQALLFMTPIIYPISNLKQSWQSLMKFNPMMGIIEGFRWCFLGIDISSNSLIISIVETMIILLTSILYFQFVERDLADIV